MPKPYASAVVNASVDEVWAFVRDFDNLDKWLPAVESSQIEGGQQADTVGCVRRLTLGDGGVVRERLLALDDVDRSYTYEFVESPFPVRSYRATIRFASVTDTGQAFAEWWTLYDADAKDEEELNETFSKGIFATGLAALRRRFESR